MALTHRQDAHCRGPATRLLRPVDAAGLPVILVRAPARGHPGIS